MLNSSGRDWTGVDAIVSCPAASTGACSRRCGTNTYRVTSAMYHAAMVRRAIFLASVVRPIRIGGNTAFRDEMARIRARVSFVHACVSAAERIEAALRLGTGTPPQSV
jgi:hypothetical protein